MIDKKVSKPRERATDNIDQRTQSINSPRFSLNWAFFGPPRGLREGQSGSAWGDQVVEIGQKRPLEKKLEQGFFLVLLCFLAL